MLYLFSGDDIGKRNQALEELLQSLPKDVETLSVDQNNFDAQEFENFYSSAGLFSARRALILNRILEKEETAEFLMMRLPALAESESFFIFLEGKISRVTLDIFKKARGELNIFELPVTKKEKFNNFTLANALGERDKFSLWISFRQALNHGATLEELAGILFWKSKDMILKKNFSKLSKEELQNFSSRISYLLPEARREGRDAEAALEEFLLEAF